ncbi:hypothetical protein [Methylophaga sp. OBS4]|uniref:hypothetical protein n=1 Tax=Methylophaga sp. OBS4 TaxID=2991935 RepID=UPI00225BA284|nr:hypothetical protein [Methylophaga sp. OBS4]MCX4186289.1 hypothetical protein [Methylophaga sp. OBS4]
MIKLHWSTKPYLRWLTLLTSSTTLLCCTLPILLVTLGSGAFVAGLRYDWPFLIFLSEHKYWTLTLAALLLGLLAWFIWRPGQSCPSEPALADYCVQAQRWNKGIFWISVSIWSVGFFFSVILLPLRQLFG